MTPAALAPLLLGLAAAQRAGTRSVEGGPGMALRECSGAGKCKSTPASVTLDANWRWVHATEGYGNCYKGAEWDATLCPDPETCAQNCALEAVTSAEYQSTYGISAASGGVTLKFVSKTQYGNNYGSRVYLMNGQDKYRMFQLTNREFSLQVDVSQLPCGLNGAVYFVEMDEHGGMGGSNEAGARYGTGYCDAQCPHDIKFIDGEANVLDWNATANPPTGHYGTCCAEMDIWEANSMATAYTPHPCTIEGAKRCDGVMCGDTESGERYSGVCDKDGCDFNSYRMGEQSFFGAGSDFAIDTTKPVTVVTQFLTADGTDSGDLSEIRRFYVQDGVVVPNSNASILGGEAYNSVTDAFCSAQKAQFSDRNDFGAKGSLKAMGEVLQRGVVLVMSLWDDTKVDMLWLDSTYPTNRPKSTPGIARGPCPGGETSRPEYLRANHPDASVTFRDLAVGAIGSTFSGGRRLAPAYV